jgi:hypothetical protein
MLYFFYDMDEMPQESSDNSAAQVLYFNGDMSFREMKICFNTGGKIGVDYQASLGETFPMGWQPVLQILPFETERVSNQLLRRRAAEYEHLKPLSYRAPKGRGVRSWNTGLKSRWKPPAQRDTSI